MTTLTEHGVGSTVPTTSPVTRGPCVSGQHHHPHFTGEDVAPHTVGSFAHNSQRASGRAVRGTWPRGHLAAQPLAGGRRRTRPPSCPGCVQSLSLDPASSRAGLTAILLVSPVSNPEEEGPLGEVTEGALSPSPSPTVLLIRPVIWACVGPSLSSVSPPVPQRQLRSQTLPPSASLVYSDKRKSKFSSPGPRPPGS